MVNLSQILEGKYENSMTKKHKAHQRRTVKIGIMIIIIK
jgi:hypothetical protein